MLQLLAGEQKGRAVVTVIIIVLKALWISAMIATPLLGMWLSSSLAAYRNSSLLVSLLVGLLLFPIAPLVWEAISSFRRRRKSAAKNPALTRLDRFVLRTVAINLLFVVVTVWGAPATSFRALATRGDWMLEGRTDGASAAIRRHLFTIADGLEGLYGRSETNHFGASDTAPPEDAPLPDEPSEVEVDPGIEEPTLAVGDTTYPAAAAIHPVAASVPASAQNSYKAVARYIAENVSDPFERVKALHDFVTLRLTYDDATFAAYEAGRFDARPSQQAADVFVARTAVCEGYARLLSAMGAEVGIEIAYLVGRGGRDGLESDGVDHAWNAAKVAGKWYLIDATWNDGSDEYRTDYLFTPPTLFRLDHLPEEPRWQLHSDKISISQFMRQPMISAGFVLLGLEMREPDRGQVTVDGRVVIAIANPRGVHIIASVKRPGHPDRECSVTPGRLTEINCTFAKSGRYTVDIFGRRGSRAGSYPHIAKLLVNSK